MLKRTRLPSTEPDIPNRASAGAPSTGPLPARILYRMITTKQAYDESIFAAEEQRQRKRTQSKLKRKAYELGYTLVPLPQGA